MNTINFLINDNLNVLSYGNDKKNHIANVASELINTLKAKDVCVVGCDVQTIKFVCKDSNPKNNGLMFKESVAKYIAVMQGVDLNDTETYHEPIKVTPLLQSLFFKEGKDYIAKLSKVGQILGKESRFTKTKAIATLLLANLNKSTKLINSDLVVKFEQGRTESKYLNEKILEFKITSGIANDKDKERHAKKQLQLAASSK